MVPVAVRRAERLVLRQLQRRRQRRPAHDLGARQPAVLVGRRAFDGVRLCVRREKARAAGDHRLGRLPRGLSAVGARAALHVRLPLLHGRAVPPDRAARGLEPARRNAPPAQAALRAHRARPCGRADGRTGRDARLPRRAPDPLRGLLPGPDRHAHDAGLRERARMAPDLVLLLSRAFPKSIPKPGRCPRTAAGGVLFCPPGPSQNIHLLFLLSTQ